MSVKSIFKVLIGTVVIIVISFIVIEMFNVSTTGVQINQLTKLSCNKACELFSQETYKKYNSNGGAMNVPAVMNMYGSEYISGSFYGTRSADTIYTDIYTGREFRSWLATEAVTKGNWMSLKLLSKTLSGVFDTNIEEGTPDYAEAALGKMYVNSKMTPVNMGIPYLDKDILTSMFQWNLATLLSNCDSDNIKVDSNGKTYVSFKGFRVYADEAEIVNLEYKTFDISPSGLDRAEFKNITNIDPDNLKFEFDERLRQLYGEAYNDNERNRVCLVGIRYRMPMAYEGITPIKKAFEFVWNTQVDGLNNQSQRTGTGQTWNDTAVMYESGGFTGVTSNGAALPVPGKLIFYVIR